MTGFNVSGAADDERIVKFLELAGVVTAHSFKAVFFFRLKQLLGCETIQNRNTRRS